MDRIDSEANGFPALFSIARLASAAAIERSDMRLPVLLRE
jgi:hypothetical protein